MDVYLFFNKFFPFLILIVSLLLWIFSSNISKFISEYLCIDWDVYIYWFSIVIILFDSDLS